MNKAIAELIGAFIFVLFGLGAVVIGAAGDPLSVALAFGFVLVAVVAIVGGISGAHVNPAVTLGMVLTGRQSVQDGVQYWIAQLVGAVAGAGVLKLVLETTDLPSELTTSIGGNVITSEFGTTGTFILEALLAAAFVLVYLRVTEDGAPVVGSALTLGFTFAMTYLVAVPIDNGGINPAKSLGAAIFEGGDTDALEDVWLFILAPLVGAVLAALVAPLLRSDEPTTTRTRESVPN